MYTCEEDRYTVESAPNFLLSTNDLRESIRATKKCLADYGRATYHDNLTGESWECVAPKARA